jgi:hypothetical protein
LNFICQTYHNSVYDDHYLAKYVADLTDIFHIFQSKNEANQWIEWNFNTAEIEPTRYSIWKHDYESGGDHLQHLILEGRIGDEKWRVLDEHWGGSLLNGSPRIATFDITTLLRIRKIRLRKIRLRQIGPNHCGDHPLAFTALELFGDLLRHSF